MGSERGAVTSNGSRDVGIDGTSIGSNDFTQLVLGVDRDNDVLAKDFDERNEAVMLALEQLVTTARRRGITSSICGQAPSDYPELTEKPVEWGITSVSVNPDVIHETRKIVADGEVAAVTRDDATYWAGNETQQQRTPQTVPFDPMAAAKGGYKHFMLKEIMEQPEAMLGTVRVPGAQEYQKLAHELFRH